MENFNIRSFVQQQQANGFTGFSGTVINVSIPISQQILNEVIQETVLKRGGPVKNMALTVRDQNQLEIDLTVQKWIITKSLKLNLEIEPQINFPDSPKIRIWLSASQMLLASAIELLANAVGFLPSSVTITGRLIEVDLKMMLQQQNKQELLKYIKSAEIKGQTGKLHLNFVLGID